MFVMAGGIFIYALGFWFITKRPRPVLDTKFHISAKGTIDLRLIMGAIIFGWGWGLVGYCPGPAIVAAGAGVPQAIAFLGAMIIGMWIYGAIFVDPK